MRKTLLSYGPKPIARWQILGARANIKDILQSLKPNNDICESILGLNDLSSALPNMHQMTKSNLVQSKRNKTVRWLDSLSREQQHEVRRQRVSVGKACKKADLERSKLRQEKMIREASRRDALAKRASKEKEIVESSPHNIRG